VPDKPVISAPTALAAAKVLMDALRLEFVRRYPDREPATKPLDILEGSARRSNRRLRVNVQLINAAEGGEHIWAERFDREIADIFEVQDEITIAWWRRSPGGSSRIQLWNAVAPPIWRHMTYAYLLERSTRNPDQAIWRAARSSNVR